MARTPSNMLPLGTQAPNFKLKDTVSQQEMSLQKLKGLKGTVIMFICNHCPFVKHVNVQISQLARDYKSKGINCIAISSNDVENYPEDAPHLMKPKRLPEPLMRPVHPIFMCLMTLLNWFIADNWTIPDPETAFLLRARIYGMPWIVY